MKTKIISLLAVVALVVALAVPVFASSAFVPDLPTTGKPVWVVTLRDGVYIAYNGSYLSDYEAGKISLGDDTTNRVELYKIVDGVWSQYTSAVSCLINLADIVYDSTGVYATDDYTDLYPKCDGSTCPATDVNQDNICDDCGMTFAVLRDYGPPDPYTVWTEERQLTYPYALIYTNNSGDDFLILSKQPATFEDGAIVFREINHVIYTVFGSSWNLHQSYDEAYTSYGNIAEVYPSYNMRNEAGQIVKSYNGDFFPLPLWSQMEMVTQGEMGQLTQTTVGAMATLALCGVGLLALLMGLFLFSKRSILFPRG